MATRQTTNETQQETREDVAAEVQAQAAIDKAQEEAAKILEDAKQQAAEIVAAAEAKAATAPAAAAPSPAPEEMVKVKLFKDNDKYKDDVFVAVNGKSYQIKRGVEVEVPASVFEVLERSMKQDQATADLISAKSGEYAAEAKARNI